MTSTMHAIFEALVLYHSLSRPNLLWPGQYVSFWKALRHRRLYYFKSFSSNTVCKQFYSLLPNPRYSILFVLLFATREYTQTLCHLIRQTSRSNVYIWSDQERTISSTSTQYNSDTSLVGENKCQRTQGASFHPCQLTLPL